MTYDKWTELVLMTGVPFRLERHTSSVSTKEVRMYVIISANKLISYTTQMNTFLICYVLSPPV